MSCNGYTKREDLGTIDIYSEEKQFFKLEHDLTIIF